MFQDQGALINFQYSVYLFLPFPMAKSLPSRAWSGGSLDLGSRHLMTVKQELATEREKMESELEAWGIWRMSGYCSP